MKKQVSNKRLCSQRICTVRNTFLKATYSYKLNQKKMLILSNTNFTFPQKSRNPQRCDFKICVCLHANHAHRTFPSPTTGTTWRRDACSVVHKLQILNADEKDAISLQVLCDCEDIRQGSGKHAHTLSEYYNWHHLLCIIK